ncbi:Protein RNA-directed DNA methylation 3 [Zea mays]|nr:Protein RNA-directed DNA methylation 3 [Zea mays]AQK94728.1 Protein RNA-directed DNA methylation 3 [Zea mays]
MFKDGFLYKKVALSSLIYWGIQPTETELLKFSSSPSNRASADDLDWLSGMYGSKKRNLPEKRDMESSSSKIRSSKASDLKASTSTENYDENDEFNLHDLVLYGRKDFGVIVAVEKDGFRILKGGPEGSAVKVRKQDIKKGCVDKMFTAVDHQKKTISINDTVNVVEGPFQGKQGVVKHLYLGILFIYNESESENCGFFCAQSGSCEKIRKGLGSSTTESSDFTTPMFPEPAYEQNGHRDTERPYRSTREQLFSIGQMLRIRKGPLKGYLCRVVRIFRNDVTVKLDSLLKIVTVQADLLSVPANRGDNLSGAPASKFGSQDTSFFGSEAGKTSWDNGLPSFGSDSWQPFSSSTLSVQNAGGESEADPWSKKTSAKDDSDPWGKKTDGDSDRWGKKTDGDSDPWGKEAVSAADGDSNPWGKETVPSAAGDSDPWGKKVVSSADGDSDSWGKKATSSAVDTEKEGSGGTAWDKQAGVGGSDAAGSSWDRAVVNESEKSDNWGEACRVMDMGTGAEADTDPWGSKVKAVDMEGPNNWEKATVPPNNKLEDVSQGWGQPKGNSTEDQAIDNVSKDVDNNRACDSSLPVTEDGTWGKSKDNSCGGAGGAGGWDVSVGNWNKSSVVADAQDEGWGKGNWSSAESEETNNQSGNWNKTGASDQAGYNNWDKPKSFGGNGWNKGDDQNSSWNRPENFGGGRGFGRGQGRGRGQQSGYFNGRNDQGSWKKSWGSDNAERPSWRSDNQVDNEAGESGGYRGRGRGGRGQYGGRGKDNGWRNDDRSNSGFGRENNSGDGPKWGGGGNWNATNPPSSSVGTKSYGQNQPFTWNNSEDNKPSVGEQGDPWASKVSSTEDTEQQNDSWSSKMISGGAEDTSGGWDTKVKDSSCNDGGEGLQNDPWANKIGSNEGKEQETDPWASKMSSTVCADDKKGSWNTTAKGIPSKEKADDPWNSKGGNDDSKKTDTWGAGSSGGDQELSWSKPNFSLGDQESTWNNPRFSDDDNANNRGGFGRGNRGRGRGRNFGDGGGSSWNGGNRNDESGGGRSGEPWNRRDFDGGGGRGRGRFGRGDRNQGNNFGSGDGGSWGSGRGNGGRGGYRNWNDNNERSFGEGGGWSQSQSSDWNANKGNGEGNQAFSKSKPSWEAQNTSGRDGQAGKGDANNSWSKNRSSPSSAWGAPSGGAGGRGSWGKSNEDGWNSAGGSAKEKPAWGGGSEASTKKEDKGGEGNGSQGGGGVSSWDKGADDAWNGNTGSDIGSGGW